MVLSASQDFLGASPPSFSESCQPICVLVPPGPLPKSSSIQLVPLPIYLRGQSLESWQSSVPHMAFKDTPSSSLGPDPHPLDLPFLQGASGLSEAVISASSSSPTAHALGCACAHTAVRPSLPGQRPRPRVPGVERLCPAHPTYRLPPHTTHCCAGRTLFVSPWSAWLWEVQGH